MLQAESLRAIWKVRTRLEATLGTRGDRDGQGELTSLGMCIKTLKLGRHLLRSMHSIRASKRREARSQSGTLA